MREHLILEKSLHLRSAPSGWEKYSMKRTNRKRKLMSDFHEPDACKPSTFYMKRRGDPNTGRIDDMKIYYGD